jgi:branched-chain amino acid transport system permease protein
MHFPNSLNMMKPIKINKTSYIFHALMIIFLITAPFIFKGEYSKQLLIVSLLAGAQAMVSDFTIGFINISNFGFAAFFGLGAYVSALTVIHFGISPYFGFILGAVAAGILGLFTGILTMRLRGLYVAIMAWFIGMAVQALAFVLVKVTRGSLGLSVPQLVKSMSLVPYYYVLLLLVAIIYFTIRIVVNSRIGLAFRAIGQDLDYARASGINPAKYKMIAFTISCTFAGLLGSFYAHFVGVLTPDLLDSAKTTEVIALNVIGGRGTIWGSLLMGLIVIPLLEYFKNLMEIRQIFYGLFLVLVIVFYPTGFAGLLKMLYQQVPIWSHAFIARFKK